VVFNKGIPHALTVAIPTGGQTHPISTTGFKLEWKNAQKKAKNNIISETIKRTTPKRRPFRIPAVYCPSKEPSLIISRNQKQTLRIKMKRPQTRIENPSLYECI
jgi:hypothetical protein